MPTSPDLHRELSNVDLGNHLCLVYEGVEEQLATLVPYIRGGLQRGERCVHIADAATSDPMAEVLRLHGLDVEGEVARGALVLLTQREAYLRTGAFHPEAMIQFLHESADQAMAEGFRGLRVTGAGPEEGSERLFEYENLLNDFFPGSHAHAICQYDRHRLPARVISEALRTHPFAIVDGMVCPNAFYEPPNIGLGRPSDEELVDWRLLQLKSARARQRSVERAERHFRFLSEVSRLVASSFEPETVLGEVLELAVSSR